MILVSVQLKNPTGQTLDSLNYLDSCNQAELNDGGGRASYFLLLHTYIEFRHSRDTNDFHNGMGCSSYWSWVLRGIMGKLFIETVITGGRG